MCELLCECGCVECDCHCLGFSIIVLGLAGVVVWLILMFDDRKASDVLGYVIAISAGIGAAIVLSLLVCYVRSKIRRNNVTRAYYLEQERLKAEKSTNPKQNSIPPPSGNHVFVIAPSSGLPREFDNRGLYSSPLDVKPPPYEQD